MRAVKQTQLDPLYVIFEQHLCNFQDADLDRKTFIANVLTDYFTYMRKLNITVPKPLEALVNEELSNQVHLMLVKKIYGCLSIQDYQEKVPSATKKKARIKYSQMIQRAEHVEAMPATRVSSKGKK